MILVCFGAEHRRKDAAGALVHLAQDEALLRCAFPAERPRIAARYVGLSRHLRLQIASGWTRGRKDIDCATARPGAVSKRASHGCIRLTNWDALELAKYVSKGTLVSIERGASHDRRAGRS